MIVISLEHHSSAEDEESDKGRMSWLSLIILSGTAQEAELINRTAAVILHSISPALFVLLYYVVPSPYGKLATPQWQKILGPAIPARIAWFLFELPNLIWIVVTLWAFVTTDNRNNNDSRSPLLCNIILLLFFVIHYIRRTLWYPIWQMSPRATPSSLGVVLNALAYTSVNGYLQCQSLLQFQRFPPQWLFHPFFGGGLVLATTGMIINAKADAAMQRLRSHHHGKGYQIPHGYWLFEYVSCPHYLGEIMEWVGFALACPTVVAASFAAFTAANLIPRAVQQHSWYRRHFGEAYPSHRKAWLPFLW